MGVQKRVDFILTKSVSRLSRNVKHLIEIVEELKAHGGWGVF
ncbi:hypothetical protein AJ85_06495 [Alkalihalobacillus alcalophilus ATCC 27647 = CGMCC 1.3604]|uniref:Resolvase/invertase-type recombinase catalytic domain-containing protein n=1 Tax=Alkalihalobacillus alcalophilus ATCC 27647 = CGMCC 1.3604 TaxID=1218173 RepID=A0A4S4K0S2_ALKAL|nr:hypothetical protein AJ85_06495 [Alkalihalobacillus alcalophilus ATCC 27647 = CGMCC 1.3604]